MHLAHFYSVQEVHVFAGLCGPTGAKNSNNYFIIYYCYVLYQGALLQSFNDPEIRVTQGPGGARASPTQYTIYYCVFHDTIKLQIFMDTRAPILSLTPTIILSLPHYHLRLYRLMETEGTWEFETYQHLLHQWEKMEQEVLEVRVTIGMKGKCQGQVTLLTSCFYKKTMRAPQAPNSVSCRHSEHLPCPWQCVGVRACACV